MNLTLTSTKVLGNSGRCTNVSSFWVHYGIKHCNRNYRYNDETFSNSDNGTSTVMFMFCELLNSWHDLMETSTGMIGTKLGLDPGPLACGMKPEKPRDELPLALVRTAVSKSGAFVSENGVFELISF